MDLTYPTGTPNWVDLGTTDIEGAVEFYGRLFGWTAEDMGPEAGGYRLFRKDGKQVAGVGPATDPARGTSWATYFSARDVDYLALKVEEHGGTVIMAPMDVMDQGRMAVFADPTGAFFSAWQPGKHTGAELVNEPGSLTWNELLTTDVHACKVFYQEVFAESTRDVSMGEGIVYTLLQVQDRPVAGMMALDPAWGPLPPHWLVYFAVDDCDAVYATALESGATKLMPPMSSPPGRFALLTDPQGARFAIIRNNPDFSI